MGSVADMDCAASAAIAGQYAPQMLVMTDPDYRILWANKAAERAFAPLECLVGRFCYEAIEGRDAVCHNCVVARSHASGQAEEDEIRDVAENGRPLHFLVHAQPIFGEDGCPVAWLESTIGLTSIRQLNVERKRLQILLSMQESEGRFASLAQVAPIGIGISVANRWVWLNELFASIFGYEPDTMIGAAPLDLVLPSMRDMVSELFASILQTKSCTNIEDLEIVRRDGEQRIVSAVSTYCVYRGEDAIMSVVWDVTEERHASALVEQRNRDLRALNMVATALGRSLRLAEVLDESLHQVMQVTNADAAMIGLLGQQGTGVALFSSDSFPATLKSALEDACAATLEAPTLPQEIEVWSTNAQAKEAGRPQELQEAGMAVLMHIPLRGQDRTVGMLWITAKQPDAFSSVSDQLLQSMGHEIAMALANAQLFEQVDGRNKQLAAINSIATALNRSLDISEVLNIALDEMIAITQACAGAISLVDPEAGIMRLATYRNVPAVLHEMLREARIADGWEARVVDGDRVLTINDLQEDPHVFPETLQTGLRSAVCVPLKAHEQTVAVLNLLSSEPNRFVSVSEEFLLSVGSQIGLAVANARLFMEKADSEELYRDLFETVPDPVVLISLDRARLLRTNRPFRECFGYTSADVADLSIEKLIVPDDRPKARAGIEALLADEALTSTQFEIRCIRKDGQVRDVLVHAVPYHSQNKLLGFQAVARDITDQKRLQSHLIRTEKLSALGQLVSGVAHELNNPLATILLAAEILLQDEQDPNKRARLEVIIEQVSRSSALTEDLRLFARREEPQRELVDVSLLLQRVHGLVAPAFKRENIQLFMDLPQEIPPVAGDAHQLEQVALNLLTNSLQAMEGQAGNNSLTVTVETGDTLPEADCTDHPPTIKIKFADTGPGVSPEARSRIFDPFHTSKPPGKGTGLGLSVSLGIAESHNGTIYLESATTGATFVLELPQAMADSPVGIERQDIPQLHAVQPVDMGGVKVLVVDDEVNIIQLLTDMLRASNCEVTGVSNASDALRALTSGPYDVVLCDVKMPLVQGTPGYAAIVHAYPALASCMVLMSGDTANLDTVQLLDSTQGPTLRKPFTYEQLIDVLHRITDAPSTEGGMP